MADGGTPLDLPAHAAQASHDLNNLLMVIIGHADLLAETLSPDDPMRSSADEILQAALRAQELSNGLLEAARAAKRPSAA
jgi:signal transduction histidine kinase